MGNRLNTSFHARSKRMRAWYAKRRDLALERLQSSVIARIDGVLDQPCPMRNLPRGQAKTLTETRLREHLRRFHDRS